MSDAAGLLEFLSAATPSRRSGGKKPAGGRVSGVKAPRFATRGPVGLASMDMQAVFGLVLSRQVSRAAESQFLGYNDVRSGIDEPWLVRRLR
jgi:hypothetical protein